MNLTYFLTEMLLFIRGRAISSWERETNTFYKYSCMQFNKRNNWLFQFFQFLVCLWFVWFDCIVYSDQVMSLTNHQLLNCWHIFLHRLISMKLSWSNLKSNPSMFRLVPIIILVLIIALNFFLTWYFSPVFNWFRCNSTVIIRVNIMALFFFWTPLRPLLFLKFFFTKGK